MADEIPAGWYPNPHNAAEELYWSGTAWTGISRAASRAPEDVATAASGESDLEESTVMRPVAGVSPAPVPPAAGSVPAYDAATTAFPVMSTPPLDAPAGGPPPAVFPPEALPPYAPPQPGSVASPADAAFPAYAAAPDASSIRWSLGAPVAPPRTNPRARLGLVATIVGIVACVLAIIPGASLAAWVPAFVAIALGIVSFLGGRPRSLALAGIITGGAALVVGTAVSIWFLVALAHG
jgi:hypothetical protein